MDEWKEATRSEVHKVRKTISTGLDFGSQNRNKPHDTGPFQTGQNQCTPQSHPPANNNSIADTLSLPYTQGTDLSEQVVGVDKYIAALSVTSRQDVCLT